MTINKEWHLKNKMPKNPTFEQRLKWHEEHNKNCSCHPGFPKKLEEEIEKKKEGKKDQKALAIFAADCAEHVLKYFEKECPKDNRPKEAIKAARDWAHDKIKVAEARKFAFEAHAAARSAKTDSAIFAARSAGHAAATAHVIGHFQHSINYAIKSAEAAGIKNEREWQNRILTKR